MAFEFQNPFVWGQNGQKLTPDQVAQYRKVAEALAEKGTAPKNLGEGLSAIGDALLYRQNMGQADAGAKAGAAEAQAVFDKLGPNASQADLMAAMADPWVQQNPGQSAVTEALLKQQLQQQDPAYQLDLDYKRSQIANAGVSPGYQWNADHTSMQAIPGGPYDPANPLNQSKLTAPRPMTPDERKQWGIPDTDTRPYAFGKGGVPQVIGGTGVTINTGDNTNEFVKKSDDAAAARLNDIVTAGQGAPQFMGDMQTLAQLSTQIGTGKGAELLSALGPYAQMVGIDTKGLDEAQAYQSIVDRLAPQMRTPGAGASSDFDARQFLSSLPSLGKTPEGNQIIMDTLNAMQQYKIAAADIASKAFLSKDQGGITWQEAEKQIRAMPNPYEGFNDYRKRSATGTPPPANPDSSTQMAPAAAPARPQTQADFDALPSGAVYIDPDDNQTYRKP